MEIKCINYIDEVITKEYDPKDILYISVVVLSGDEIVTIFHRDENGSVVHETLDHGGRLMNFYDGQYTILPDQIDDWNKRKNSYMWLDNSED